MQSCNHYRVNKEVVLHLEFIILREIDFNLHQPTPLDYLEIYYRLLDLETEEQWTVERIKKTAFKMCRYVSQNASFLGYSIQKMTAAVLLLSINFCGVSDLFKDPEYAKNFDPSIIWDYELHYLTGLSYECDI